MRGGKQMIIRSAERFDHEHIRAFYLDYKRT